MFVGGIVFVSFRMRSIVYSCCAPCWFVPTHFLTVLSSLNDRVHIICFRLTIDLNAHPWRVVLTHAFCACFWAFAPPSPFTDNLEISLHFMNDGKLHAYGLEQSQSNCCEICRSGSNVSFLLFSLQLPTPPSHHTSHVLFLAHPTTRSLPTPW